MMGTVTLVPGAVEPDPTDNVACCASRLPEAMSTSNCAVIIN